MARKAGKLKIRRSSKFAIILLAILIFAMGLMLQNMTTQLAYAQKEQEVYAHRLAALQEKNDQLRQDIENSDDPNLIEDIARNDLGMASHGEKIFRFQY